MIHDGQCTLRLPSDSAIHLYAVGSRFHPKKNTPDPAWFVTFSARRESTGTAAAWESRACGE